MRKSGCFIWVLIIVAAAVGYCFWRQKGKDNTVVAPAERRTPVGVMLAVASNIEDYVTGTGNAVAFEEVNVSAQISERLMAVLVNEGDVVTSGQVLALLDKTEAQASLDAMVATEGSVEQGLQETTVSTTNALRNFDRAEQLFKKNVVGRQQFEEQETASKMSMSRLQVALALLRQARAKVSELRVKVDRCTITAPMDGVIAERNLDPGAFVTPGTPIVRVTRMDPISIKVQVPESQIAGVRMGCAAMVETWGDRGVTLTGTVIRIYPVLHERWRTQTVEISCPNRDRAAQPGMFADVKIITGSEPAMLVSEVAVMRLPGSGITHLYIVQDGKAKRVDARVVRKLGAMVAVDGALDPGAEVIVKGQQRIQTGMAVTASATEMLP